VNLVFLEGTRSRSKAQQPPLSLPPLTSHHRIQASPFSLFFASELTPLTPSAPVGFGEMALDNRSGGGAGGAAGGAATTATTATGTAGNVADGVAPSPTGGAFDLDCLDVHGR